MKGQVPTSSARPVTDARARIAVITVTRRRPRLLQRVIASVQAQTVLARITHVVIIDDCAPTLAMLERVTLPDNVEYEMVERKAGEVTGPARAAQLRNFAQRRLQGGWTAFLDDDNEYHSVHLAELLRVACESGADAVHSYRELRNNDGTPYLEPRDPWCEDETHGRASYRQLVNAGIMTPGSCIMKAVARPDAPRSVDTSEWLVADTCLRGFLGESVSRLRMKPPGVRRTTRSPKTSSAPVRASRARPWRRCTTTWAATQRSSVKTPSGSRSGLEREPTQVIE